MSDKYAALRAAAEKAGGDEWQAKKISGENYVIRKGSYRAEYGFKTYQPIGEFDDKAVRDFIVATSPATILALLAEREADKALIAELDDALCKLLPGCEYMDPPDGGSPSLITQIQRMVEDYRQRIAELESRKLLVNIRQWDEFTVQHFTSCSDDYAAGWVNGRDHAQDEIRKSCAAAGITLETGE